MPTPRSPKARPMAGRCRSFSDGHGEYTLGGTAAADTAANITAALDALTLTAPSTLTGAVNGVEMLTFSLSDTTSAYALPPTAATVTADILAPTFSKTFGYTGNIETFTVQNSGYYDIAADGAQGGVGFPKRRRARRLRERRRLSAGRRAARDRRRWRGPERAQQRRRRRRQLRDRDQQRVGRRRCQRSDCRRRRRRQLRTAAAAAAEPRGPAAPAAATASRRRRRSRRRRGPARQFTSAVAAAAAAGSPAVQPDKTEA